MSCCAPPLVNTHLKANHPHRRSLPRVKGLPPLAGRRGCDLGKGQGSPLETGLTSRRGFTSISAIATAGTRFAEEQPRTTIATQLRVVTIRKLPNDSAEAPGGHLGMAQSAANKARLLGPGALTPCRCPGLTTTGWTFVVRVNRRGGKPTLGLRIINVVK